MSAPREREIRERIEKVKAIEDAYARQVEHTNFVRAEYQRRLSEVEEENRELRQVLAGEIAELHEGEELDDDIYSLRRKIEMLIKTVEYSGEKRAELEEQNARLREAAQRAREFAVEAQRSRQDEMNRLHTENRTLSEENQGLKEEATRLHGMIQQALARHAENTREH